LSTTVNVEEEGARREAGGEAWSEALGEALGELDKAILNIIQEDFPLAARPFREIASTIGATEEEVLLRVQELRSKGIIRRLGGVFDSRQLGFVSTLVALQVAPEKLGDVGKKISSFPEVTHNYQRNHAFNLWFTLTAETEEKLREMLETVQRLPGVEKLRNLPAERRFKIHVHFPL